MKKTCETRYAMMPLRIQHGLLKMALPKSFGTGRLVAERCGFPTGNGGAGETEAPVFKTPLF
jgi:hypothetical protein